MRKSTVATPHMVAHCFGYLNGHLNGDRGHPELPDHANQLVDGIFVTWETSNGALRGCIGYLSELPLSKLSEYAITSSQKDSRFSPIRLHELPRLTCNVSILHSMEQCNGHKDWTIGTHGIIVDLHHNGRNHRSTFLPHVIPKQGWTHEEAIIEACLKSGFRGDPRPLFPKIRITRYQSSKASLTYSEYIRVYCKNSE